ncbi:RNA-directed DNA polymerase, eukaryota, reverse transcriptase zinc-binding domain protein [Tanacetum coccineum]|uniref:RNA-directed DNA polymerase, eukaryota, reverse transcriptase zinc-binding domain protein n=1 Tax=Tanacetum coccineum TaxID=301880 RepID=A0ABQ5C9R7_9ASTR
MVSWIMICVKSTSFTICLNGEMNGFFKGGRGLRQGDPISPYLFTLVMEVFSLIMEKNIEESRVFCYHFGCKELKLSHMCFADDLLVLCKEIENPLKFIQERDKLDLLQVMPLKCGKLSVRYLGVPLLAKKLGVSDYKEDVQEILWNAGDSAKGKARVAWKVVCRPKEQGGLGIKSLKQWNKVLLIRQFWNILEGKNSLWAKWVNRVKLKDKSIWEVDVDKGDSWGWKTMLTIRDNIRGHVWYNVGNGRKTSVWYDKWCTDGPLSKFISRRDIYEARLEDNAKLLDCPNIEDKVLWDTNDGRKVEFSTNQADLRVNWPNVVRRHIVWFNHLIPRQAFIFWMAVQDKLLTQDKIEKWNHDGDFKCGLCKQCSDSTIHLFF